ncbi:hypothetical protein C7974DRAFT_462830 [Boeremia exigua]|uniref:uncharacterized protein n=1 Tax=Boeremia exigua TaxID=749465 RepID=UPI001E8EC679|nr:uncharacterized protein C7974DRAFT_462830 [Boeremia exigua]KAH6633196.1 hypothetical protein C7974DRAFT_462830 [Boeremia exigua]
MEGLSIVANGLAVVSVAFQLSEACVKLYIFWESIEDAPQEISAIKEDLQYLISVFRRIESAKTPLGHCIAEGIQHCRIKVVSSSSLTGQRYVHPLPVMSQDVAKNALMYFEQAVPEQALANFTVQELMLHAISQTAIATFKSTSLEIFAQDGYMIDECGQIRAKTFVYSKSLRYRVSHQASSFRTALGCLWVRTTTISRVSEFTGQLEKSQTVTSVVFYPTRWLQLLGIRNGVEAIVASAGRSWLYNCKITVTRAVPEDSMIFDLCLAGETRAVQLLLEKGQGSVVDTSPKGWKPLHYAAVAGHADLCALLIRAGADKSALVYEGPTESVLAEEKIEMLRLFCDCIDLSDADSDGWLVHEWLKKAYATERKPISQNSITWLLHLTANEEYVEFSARNVWSALQHGLRSVLNHGRFGDVLGRILDLSEEECENTSQRHIDSLGAWLALRVNGRVLLPMAQNAGSFLQMKGFDWIADDMPHRQFLQALPNIYSAWCHSVIEAVEQVETYMREDLEQCFSQLCLTRETFLTQISHANTLPQNPGCGQAQRRVCTDCQDDYSALDSGLVEPARIAVAECVMTGHSFDCACQTVSSTKPYHLPTYSGACSEDEDDQVDDIDEQFYDTVPHLFDDVDPSKPDAFSEIATVLYRAHGRVWIGSYAIGEQLCASCFLSREQYIGEDGLAADFPPMPESFQGLRAKW